MTKMPTGVQNTLCEHPTILAKTEYRGHRIKGNQEGKILSWQVQYMLGEFQVISPGQGMKNQMIFA